MSAIRVVIAEDDPRIAEIQRRFVSRVEGFEVVGVAHQLEEAQDMVDVLEPDLLMLDIQFPGGSGLELLRALRGRNQSTDVILVTAAQEVDTLRDALRCGVFDYIIKPLVFDRLEAALKQYADHLEKLRRLERLEQRDVDTLLPRQSGADPAAPEQPARLPKGIDALTLEKVRKVFAEGHDSLSAEAVGERVGASRTTARRYLEYLVSCGELGADLSYGSVGRPERRYQRVG